MEQSNLQDVHQVEKIKHFHILSKRLLMSTDLFLFDVGKARTENNINYELLEQIKNGRTLASKFDSKELKFHTPNTLIIWFRIVLFVTNDNFIFFRFLPLS